MKTLFIYLSIILLVIATWNAYVILWKTETDDSKKYSKIWHSIGLALRVMVYAIPFFLLTNWANFQNTNWGDVLKWTMLFISIGGIAYDFVINAIRFIYTGKPDLWYVDDKGWNAFFLKRMSPTWYWILRGAFVLATIAIWVLW